MVTQSTSRTNKSARTTRSPQRSSDRRTSKPRSGNNKPVRKPRTPRNRRTNQSTIHIIEQRTKHVLLRLGILFAMGLFCYLIYIYGVAPFTSRWKAQYGTVVYPEGYSTCGIDISHHQGEINWKKLSKAKIGDNGICFVYIKATEGQDFLDSNFNDNFYSAREFGMLRGAYHYFKPKVPAKAQARYFLKQVHLEEGDLPPVLDIEETGGLNTNELRKAALTWLKDVEQHYGVPPIIYTNYKFKLDYLNTKDFDRYPYWIAHYYVSSLSYKGAWKFWQHTDCGRLDGIKEKVDLNIYNGSVYDLKRLCLKEK